MSKKPKVIFASDKLYKLLDEPGRGLVLEVVVGTSAMYAVRMALNDLEKKNYEVKGNAYLDTLADEVVRDEKKFRAEGRTVPV